MKKFMILGILLTPLMIAACGPYGPMNRWGGADGLWCGFGSGYGGMFMGIIVLIALVIAVYFIVQALKTRSAGGAVPETPLDILKKRYARGEVTKEEFERIKSDL